MTSFRFALALALAAFFLGTSANAEAAGEDRLELAQTYHDLPGVRSPEQSQDREKVVCEQVFVDRYAPFESSRGPRYDTVYKCRKGDGPVFQGGQLPPSLERQKRGLNY